MRQQTRAAIAICVVAILLGTSQAAREDKGKKVVYALDEKIEGKTYAEWSAEWWKWGLTIKRANNPVLDKTGKFAGERQTAAVWFLAGNQGGTMTRKCTVPAGKPIFFPVLNYLENAPPDKADEKKLAAKCKEVMDRAADMEASLDGKSLGDIKSFRVASGGFTVVGPDKADEALDKDVVGKQKAASDGYWFMLKPLAAGVYVLKFKGKVKAEKKEDRFELDITYRLTVEEKKEKKR